MPRSRFHDLRELPLLARYGVALLTSALALLLTWLFRSFMERNLFLWFFAAIVLSTWYGGLGPGLLVIAIGSISVGYLFIEPYGSFYIGTAELLRLGVFALVALLISSLTEGRRRSMVAAQAEHQQMRVTLSSIGDAVIATDVHGRVTLMNPVAEALTGWSSAEALGQNIGSVFRIVNEATRQPAESPVERALREGTVVGLANHTLLIARDGTERPIDDSGAPIRDSEGNISGVVLVFRDITARKQAKDHPIAITCPAEPLMIEGDDLRLEQVLQNLIQNAIKYSPAGSPVDVRVDRQGTYAAIAVTDRGIGIPKAALSQLFQRFYRAPNVDEHQIGGMGIGLYVVREIINLHDGTVEVESVEDQGSTFTLRLPLMAE